MPDFNEIFAELRTGVLDMVNEEAADFVDAAKADGRAFLEAMKADLETWTGQLKNGELSQGDFTFLVKGKRDVAEMVALKDAGMAAVRVEKIVNGIIDLVVEKGLALL